jgi:S-methylmethionine-dependent homocysteine/selenocysteine methylase
MGRELLRIGAPFRQPEWSALALTEGPEWVVRAHTNFIDAGADVITTNSYAVVPFHIGEHRFAAEGRELAALAGRLAQQAATRASTRPVLVAGCLPPLFGSYRPDLFDADDAPRLIDPLVDGLADHVNVWLGETLGSIGEARAVRDALDRADRSGARPLWISYTLDDDGHRGVLRSGEPVADAVAAAIDLDATAVLFNCSQAETITAAIDVAVSIAGDEVSIGGYANRFTAAHGTNAPANEALAALREDLDPISYRAVVARWIADGASIVGGCCGIEPAHIAEIAALGSAVDS